MPNAQKSLGRPIITEKSTLLREQNKYVIQVDPSATKSQIKAALEEKYNVDVQSIKTIKLKGKYRRKMGPVGGFQSDKKKAVIKLKQGQQITWEEVA